MKGIKYSKYIDGNIIYYEEIRTGKKELAGITLYKKMSGRKMLSPSNLDKPFKETSETTTLNKNNDIDLNNTDIRYQ